MNNRPNKWITALTCMLLVASTWSLAANAIDRETIYDAIIAKQAKRRGLNADFVKALIWRESSFRANAVGRQGEIGLMQITIPAVQDWAKAHHRRVPARGDLFNPYLNIEIGTWYLARAKHYWRHREECHVLALCEYNAGRAGTKRDTTINRQGVVTIHKQRLYNYVSSIVHQFYKYAASSGNLSGKVKVTRSAPRRGLN